MEFVRKIIDANSLLKIMQLPDTLLNRKLEIIVLPADEAQKETLQKDMVDSGLSDITQSLIGSIPGYEDSEITIEQIREERLKKYESIV